MSVFSDCAICGLPTTWGAVCAICTMLAGEAEG
jgi:hypothetical protein